jgi:hypothetical protein
MQRYQTMIGLALVIALLAAPAVAFTMDSLTIAVRETGDADVTADYTLTWVERIAIFMHIAEPEQVLEKALEESTGRDVVVSSITPGRTVLSVGNFAALRETGNRTTFITPSLDFSGAEQGVKGYWFAPLVSVDASPGMTVVSFPDGHQQVFYDALVIPSVTYEEGSQPGCC